MSSTLPSVLIDQDGDLFQRDSHSYIDEDGSRRISVTQALSIAGLYDFSRVPPDVMAHAQLRGRLVHDATALIDKGESLDDFEIPEECQPRIDAWLSFCKELKYIPDVDWIEVPLIVELFGHRVGMTPDSVGTIEGVLTVVERKAVVSKHPAWRLQTAGYATGLRRVGLQIRQRLAVQLLPTGKYRLDAHENDSDYQAFGDCYRMAAWKIANGLATI